MAAVRPYLMRTAKQVLTLTLDIMEKFNFYLSDEDSTERLSAVISASNDGLNECDSCGKTIPASYGTECGCQKDIND
jgi:hypothetical protein